MPHQSYPPLSDHPNNAGSEASHHEGVSRSSSLASSCTVWWHSYTEVNLWRIAWRELWMSRLVSYCGYSRVRFPAEGRDSYLLHNVQTYSDAHPASCPFDTCGAFDESDQDVKATTHLHLVPRLRMHGARPPLYHTWCLNYVQGQIYPYLLRILNVVVVCVWRIHFVSRSSQVRILVLRTVLGGFLQSLQATFRSVLLIKADHGGRAV
jgi:hypothetical protein